MLRLASKVVVPWVLLLAVTVPLGAAPPIRLVVDEAGTVVEQAGAGRPVNPASVVKIATSLRALELLGAERRFETRFAFGGSLDRETGVLDGDLIVLGGGDPDFHVENAYRVAAALNRLGLRTVTGALRVDREFWIGWEGGSERRERDLQRRQVEMARRLRDALDPRRWNAGLRRDMGAFRERRGLSAAVAPRIDVRGAALPLAAAAGATAEVVLVHRSNPLVTILRRFNAFSNNDIERLEAHVGTAERMSAALAGRWQVPPESIRLSTLSGLGVNRLTPELVVRLLRTLAETCRRLGLEVGDLLPVAGCDPGTLAHFPGLSAGAGRGAVVAKTGSLSTTDGGVAALAGYARTSRGELLFFAAEPEAGRRLRAARRDQDAWLAALIASRGGARPSACPAALPFSDADARIVDAAGREIRSSSEP